jgi:hypothetical protein
MDYLDLIIEGDRDFDLEEKIKDICIIKDKIDSLGIYIVEILKNDIDGLESISEIKNISHTSEIATQLSLLY